MDLRYALRMLRRSPGFALVAVLTLALGIGASTSIYSVVYGVLLRPLGYPEPERLVWFLEDQPDLRGAPFSAADFLDYQSQNRSFEELAAIRTLSFNLTGKETPERLQGNVVSPNFFRMLGIRPALGRDFTSEDGQSGAPRVALLTHGFWQRHFGGAADVAGKPLTLNGQSVAVIGVLPATFRMSRGVELWLNPRDVVPEVFPNYRGEIRSNRGMHYLVVMGRLKPEVALAQAQADISGIMARIHKEHPATVGHTVRVVSFHDWVTSDVRAPLVALLVAVGFVLLIACTNIANLLLARASGRAREMGIRAALGAGRGRLVRQVLTESVLLAAAGGALGLLLAKWGTELLIALSPPGTPRLSDIALHPEVLGVSMAITLLSGLGFGIVLAWQAARISLSDALKEGTQSVTGGLRRNRLRSVLVVAEVALSLVLLVAAGLLLRSFGRLLEVRPGFNPENLVTMRISFTGEAYRTPGRSVQMMDELLPRLAALPGVEAVATSNDLPLEGSDTTGTPTIEGRPPVPPGQEVLAGQHSVSAGYFEALGIPLLRGRTFTARDVENSPPVAVINEAMARRFWPDEDPIGQRFRLFGGQGGAAREIIGVVGNVKHNGLHAPDSLEAYAPFAQDPWGYVVIALRTKSAPEAQAGAVRREVARLDAGMPVHSVRTMDEVASGTLAQRRFTLFLTGLFAALALLLAAVGLYGVMSYLVAQRTREVGIRMALGAQPGDVVRLMLGQGLLLALAGVGLGVAGALAISRMLAGMLFGISATDWLTFAAVALTLTCVALAATYVPARRAARVDPLVALRYE